MFERLQNLETESTLDWIGVRATNDPDAKS